MQQPDPAVELRSENWVAVPGEGLAGSRSDLELRPGADQGKVRVKSPSVYDSEIDIAQLREGLDKIESEHRR